MEQSTQTERVQKKVGRPKGTGIFTEEENKERERKRIEFQAKEILFKMITFLNFIF